MELFDTLPIGAIVGGAHLVVHGGLTEKGGDLTIEEIQQIHRFEEPEESTPLSEILWSDPSPFKGLSSNPRGDGVRFGPDVSHAFLDRNNLKKHIRSYEVVEGCRDSHDGRVVTVFSASNYYKKLGSREHGPQRGGYLSIGEDLELTKETYSSSMVTPSYW